MSVAIFKALIGRLTTTLAPKAVARVCTYLELCARSLRYAAQADVHSLAVHCEHVTAGEFLRVRCS